MVVLGVFVAGGVLLALYHSRAPKLGPGVGSTYLTGRQGAKALYQLLEALGWETVRLRHRFSSWRVGPRTRVLFIIQPMYPVTRREARILGGWVQGGGVLVLALGDGLPCCLPAARPEVREEKEEGEDDSPDRAGLSPWSARSLIEEFGINIKIADSAVGGDRRSLAGRQRKVPVVPAPPYTEDASELAVSGALRLDAEEPFSRRAGGEVTVLARDDAGVVVAMRSWGAGRLIVFSDTFPLTNRGLGRADNALLLVRVLEGVCGGAGSGARVLFDEYHHGFRELAGGVWALVEFFRTPAGWAALQALVVLAGWLYLGGRRFGRPVSEPRPQRRSQVEFVEALSEAYRRARGGPLALELLRRRFQERVSEALGLSASVGGRGSRLAAVLERRGGGAAERVREVLLRSAEMVLRSSVSDAALVEVAREFDELEKEIAGGYRRGG